MTNLERGLAALRPMIEVAPERYAWFAKGEECWFVTSEASIIKYGEFLTTGVNGPMGSQSFAEYLPALQMPRWWTPDARSAWRYRHPVNAGLAAFRIVRRSVGLKEDAMEQVTVDLDTGKEIPT